MRYCLSLNAPFPKDRIYKFFKDLNKFFRLNIQWTVLHLSNCIDIQKGSRFELKVRYDRNDIETNYIGIVEEFIENNVISISLDGEMPRRIIIRLEDAGENASTIYYDELIDRELAPEEIRDINLWLKSIINYISISQKTNIFNKVYKWFIDRIWLKLSPSGRRIVFLVVIAEGIAFVFFILLIIWLLTFKDF